MPPEKLLAEWFWCDRWMGSRGFLLPLEPRGLYREMLTQAWLRKARLPNDSETIQRAIGCTAVEWDRNWPLVQPFWKVVGTNLVNRTQQKVYREAMAAARRASVRGKKGAEKRWSSNAQASLKQKPPSPSPSPIVSVKNTETQEENQLVSNTEDVVARVLASKKLQHGRLTPVRSYRVR